jgi:dTDP-4-dehydrorhamnose reductase
MPAPTILVTGSNGQVGSELQELSVSFPQYSFRFFSRTELAIDDGAAIRNIFATVKPDYVINCAAYTAVDKAESEKEQAIAINATAAGLLAKACRQAGAKFIHISTDYVFNGESETPLKEDAPVLPVNFYGQSKWKGEQEAIRENAESIIIRTSWVYSCYGKNFVKTMLRLMGEKEQVSVVADQYGSPTYAADLAEAIMLIISSGIWLPGIYHFSNEGVINWAEMAEEIRRQINSACTVQFITTEQYPTPAKRPRFSVMDKHKIVAAYNITLRPWQQSLQKCLRKLQHT